MPPSAYSSQPYYGAHSISPTDHTIVGLQQMVPDLIATDEFELEQIHDELMERDLKLVQGCNSVDTLNSGRHTGPHSGPNSVLGRALQV